MRGKQKILFVLIVISFLSFTVSSANLNLVINNGAIYTYSDFILPGEELVWDVAKFEKEDDFVWAIKEGIFVEEGDQIKLVVNTDPDDLDLADYDSLQNTTQPWAEHYLNDIDLGDISSVIEYFVDAFDENLGSPERHSTPENPHGYLLPPQRESATDSIDNLFEYLVDQEEPYQYNNDSGLYEVYMTNDLFVINWVYHEKGLISINDESYELDRISEISYNLAWGYLDRMKLYEKYVSDGKGEILDFVLLNSRSTQKVTVQWLTGLIALFTLGTIAVYMRRSN
ncbi:MAG: hypothetical protein KAS22_03330 [Candidatus Heimdallarchaeota archaeon]|nr:hypothetical protein [Candidatus Heimdallarchaeota archaeon]